MQFILKLCSGYTQPRDGKGTEGIYLTFQRPIVSYLVSAYGDCKLYISCNEVRDKTVLKHSSRHYPVILPYRPAYNTSIIGHFRIKLCFQRKGNVLRLCKCSTLTSISLPNNICIFLKGIF